MCFMTPKRLRWGKASTIWVVVRGPCRKRSRIDRLVLSDKAFHTPSRSSPDTLSPLTGRTCGTVLGDRVQYVLPAGVHPLPVRRVYQAKGAVTKLQVRSSGSLFELQFQVVHCGVGHEHGAAQFEQHGRLDDLHVSP